MEPPIYHYATYDVTPQRASALIVIATNKPQIKCAGLTLFEHYKRFKTYKEAFNYIMLNVTSLGKIIPYYDIKNFDATTY